MNRFAILSALAFTQLAGAAEEKFPVRIPSPGGEVVLPDAGAKAAHDDWRYAASRRVGDMIYVSGVIVNRHPGEGNDVAAFKLQAVAPLVRFGASPRAAVHFTQAARATAALAGRAYVLPEDVKEVAMDVLRHRLILSYDAEADNVSADEVVAKILAAVPVP